MRHIDYLLDDAREASRAHASHPSTASYALQGEAGAPGGYDGAQDAFAPPPKLASAQGLQTGDGVVRHGLWLHSLELGASWDSLVAAEPRLDLSSYEAHSSHERSGGCDWKIFMEIYFDDYHVEPFHPGLASMADCSQLGWLWAPAGQAQVVGGAAGSPAGSEPYADLSNRAQRALGPMAAGAVWAALYPGTMIEWLAGGVAISTLSPSGPGACSNRVEFAYPKGVALGSPEFVRAHQAAYWETAAEDDEIGRRIQQGRDALAKAGRHEAGPAHPLMEAGIVKFHDWLEAASWRASGPKPRALR